MALVPEDVEDTIIIDPQGDLTLRLYTTEGVGAAQFASAVGNTFTNGKVLAKMLVSRRVLVNNSTLYQKKLGPGSAGATHSGIDLEDNKCDFAEIWMRAFHDSEFPPHLLDDHKATSTDMRKLSGWFEKVMETKFFSDLGFDSLRMLMYPSYVFNNAQVFALATETLAYEMSKQIYELNPTEHRHLHLDENVITSLNGAKGNLKVKLKDLLALPMHKLKKQRCTCSKDTQYSFTEGLNTIGYWDVYEFKYKPTRQILNMESFKNFFVDVPPEACEKCREAVDALSIQDVRLQIENDFQGLCLDCMTKSKTGSIHSDYWLRDLLRNWDEGCRVKHGERTWNFSFAGRKTDMDKYHLAKKSKETNPRALEAFVGRRGMVQLRLLQSDARRVRTG